MKVHRSLTITGSRAVLDHVAARIVQHATGEWSRDRDREEELRSAHLPGDHPGYCLVCTGKPGRRHAAVWLHYREGELYVSNIVPQERPRMTVEEYNAVLADFHDNLVAPAVEGAGVDVQFGAEDVEIEEWLTRDTARKLRAFSEPANKSTGAGHPLDRARWLAFLIAAYNERADLHPEDLSRWLREAEGWDAEMAGDLACEYELARDLLQAYDESRGLT